MVTSIQISTPPRKQISDIYSKWSKLQSIASYLSVPSTSAVYSGFVGHANLGDEVLWQAIHSAFKPLPMVNNLLPGNKFIQKMVLPKRHRLAVLGGGTLIGANLGDGRNPFREQFEAVVTRSDHAVVFGTGVGKLSDVTTENEWLLNWKPVLTKCDYIGVRGSQSVASLSSIGVDAEILGDPACLLAQDAAFWSPRPRTLGVNVGCSTEQVPAVEQVMLNHITQLVAARIRQGWKIEFFVVWSKDLPIVEKVIAAVGIENPTIHCVFNHATPYLQAVRSMSAFVGMKLHAVILAMCAGVPSIMIEYAPKCRDFMSSLDMEEFSININDVTLERLETYLERLLSEQKQVAANITNRMGHLREKQLSKATEILSSI